MNVRKFYIPGSSDVYEAVQIDGENLGEVAEWCGASDLWTFDRKIALRVNGKKVQAGYGDWVIRDSGGFYPMPTRHFQEVGFEEVG